MVLFVQPAERREFLYCFFRLCNFLRRNLLGLGQTRRAMMSVMIRRRVVVAGRVQGVFFRDSCRQEALRRTVAGWVANRPDGTVEAVFEGRAADVDALVGWCRTGPPQAQVTDLRVVEERLQGEPPFRVLPSTR
jgi:acylphosphatase